LSKGKRIVLVEKFIPAEVERFGNSKIINLGLACAAREL
jgi:hypothetical protein